MIGSCLTRFGGRTGTAIRGRRVGVNGGGRTHIRLPVREPIDPLCIRKWWSVRPPFCFELLHIVLSGLPTFPIEATSEGREALAGAFTGDSNVNNNKGIFF